MVAAVVQTVAWSDVTNDVIDVDGVYVNVPETAGWELVLPPSVMVIVHGAVVDVTMLELVYDASAPIEPVVTSVPTLFVAVLARHFVVAVSPSTIVFAAENTQTAIGLVGATGRWLKVRTIRSLQSILPVARVGDGKPQL